MSDASTQLKALAESLPEGGSAILPKATLMEWAAVTEGREKRADLGIAEVAERFQRSPSTIRGWLQSGVLRGYRLRGRGRRVPPASIAEFEERDICVNYAFEDTPDTGTPHNMERKHWFGFETNLALRLLMDFGKPVPPTLAD